MAEDLADEASRVLECAKQLLQTPYIPAGASRRRWLRQLTDGTVAERDELPSLVLPSRLLARVAPNDLAVRLSSLENGDIESAKILELAALAEGLTMEAWAYRCALRLVAR